MRVTAPLTSYIVLQFDAAEADTLLLALTHTRREYLGTNERNFINSISHEIGSRIVRRVEFSNSPQD